MSGKKGMKWPEKKARFPHKKNTALCDKYAQIVENKATKEQISESAVIRQAVEKAL